MDEMSPNIQDDEMTNNSVQCDKITHMNSEDNSESLPYISVGMEFKTHEEAWLLYVNHSSVKGFQPRKHTTYKSTSTQLTIGRTYVCSKEGKKHIGPVGNAVKRKRETRENCPARMRITFDQNRGTWRVTQFIDDHCHELGLSLTKSIHGEHKIHLSPMIRKVIECLHASGVGNSTIAKVINSGALNNELFVTNQHGHDQVRRVRGSNIGFECVSVIQQFQDKSRSDPMFFFDIDLDTDRTLRNVFWADGQSRKAYLEFNDVVSFNVTCRINKFSLSFATCTGVDHHRQSTLFGCALLADETEESFVWLFKQWLKCMFDIAPKAIITDQDEQICSAIKRVFPNVRHCYCSWHVNKNVVEHLGLLKPDNKGFADDFYVWFDSESIVESEARWDVLKRKYSLGDRNWLVSMYEKRKHWVPAYMRDVLTCGMKSTQRSESINSFFDGYVHSMTSLSEFVQQYDKALASRRKAEKDEDFATLNSKPSCESGLPWEVQAASFYTRKLYEIFHQEFIPSQSYLKEKVSKNGDATTYRVGKMDIHKSSWKIVVYDASDGVSFTCSCAKFESEGMLCRHIMAIMRQKQILVIPEKYLLKRWSINARFRATPVCDSSMATRVLDHEVVTPVMLLSLQFKHHKILDEASSSVSILKEYENYLDTFLADIMKKKLNVSNQVISPDLSLKECIESTPHITIRDPNQPVRTKGRPKIATRNKSNRELLQQQQKVRQNRCKSCGELGHNSAGCQLRKALESE